MTKTEIKDMIALLQLPYAYHHFAEGEAPALPYVIFRYPQSSNFSADSGVYLKADDLDIELYTEKRDIALELRVETLLDAYNLFYQKTETYIEDENMYEILYEMEGVVMG